MVVKLSGGDSYMSITYNKGTDIDGIDFVEEFKDGRLVKVKSIYKIQDIPKLEKMIDGIKKTINTDRYQENVTDWGSGDSLGKLPHQYRKIIGLLKTGVSVEGYSEGMVLVEGKFIVSLNKNRWRVNGKGTWYFHPYDLKKWIKKLGL